MLVETIGVDNKIILLVEDSADDKLLTLRAFKKNDIKSKVIIARDGIEALHYLFATGPYEGRSSQEMPDIILLDLKLPRVDGFEVLRQMRAKDETSIVPVIILTSSAEPQDLKRCYKLGANSYIRKPVDFGDFSEVVRQLEYYWFELNEMPPREGEYA